MIKKNTECILSALSAVWSRDLSRWGGPLTFHGHKEWYSLSPLVPRVSLMREEEEAVGGQSIALHLEMFGCLVYMLWFSFVAVSLSLSCVCVDCWLLMLTLLAQRWWLVREHLIRQLAVLVAVSPSAILETTSTVCARRRRTSERERERRRSMVKRDAYWLICWLVVISW